MERGLKTKPKSSREEEVTGPPGTLLLMSQRNPVTQWKNMAVLITLSIVAACGGRVYFGSQFEGIAHSVEENMAAGG